jgi:hypothetical protein
MHIIISYPTGLRVEGVLLSASHDRMRIILPREKETLELRLAAGCWESETGEAVEVESILSAARIAAPAPLTFAAGHYC